MKYAIRAELPDNKVQDLEVNAEELEFARSKAEGMIIKANNLDLEFTQFDWRGQVVFVNQGMGVRV